ncbi:hypothetical protein QAD02_005957 [Eretmocerus hayati]|uniref:Uncharacterized protein n=1 Tax=Eretmocerus hayati TaxID=131215 RepID=A0ACC2MZP3_9HYME|nr:hypothetical protein QAD02_005957 [Eretmocerus hayati]
MASCWPKKISKLEIAVSENNHLKVKQYLDQGVSKQLLLFFAVRNSNPDMVELAIARGADLNFRTSKEVTGKSSHIGKSLKKLLPPIYAALKNCDVKMMKLLIEKGASVDVKNKKGESPLLYAVRTIESSKEQLQSVQVLLQNGAQLDECRHDDGLCALHFGLDGRR